MGKNKTLHLILFYDFSRRNKKEYLKGHKRYQWKTLEKTPKLGDCITIHDDYLSPYRGRLGPKEKLLYGSDVHIGVVELRTQTETLTKLLVKLCLLLTTHNTKNVNNNQ